jgi:hypothetical protein
MPAVIGNCVKGLYHILNRTRRTLFLSSNGCDACTRNRQLSHVAVPVAPTKEFHLAAPRCRFKCPVSLVGASKESSCEFPDYLVIHIVRPSLVTNVYLLTSLPHRSPCSGFERAVANVRFSRKEIEQQNTTATRKLIA